MDKLKSIYCQLLQGYSHIKTLGEFTNVYIKHLDNSILAASEDIYSAFYERAVKGGTSTTQDRLKALKETGDWTDKEEEEIKTLNVFLDGLRNSKNKLFKKSEIEEIQAHIVTTETKIKELLNKKNTLIGLCAEIFATKKMNEYFIFYSLYKNAALVDKYFSEEEFDDVDEQTLSLIIGVYNAIAEKLSPKNLKKIAISSYFLNYFYLC